MKKNDVSKFELVKAVHPARPDWPFYLPKEDKKIIEELGKPAVLTECERPCTKVMTLLPKTPIEGQTGIGYHMINVDGFRHINAFVISDPLNSSAYRGFTLELSFSVNDFVYGVGVIGEARYFFNFENFYDPGNYQHRLIHCGTDYLTSTGGLPHIGGNSLAHILRVPVMGPYVRASVFNEDTVIRNAEVKGYLTT
jgi:hypothetical protein